MASDIFHIKDNFYFEVPKAWWRSDRETPEELLSDYGPWVIRNDQDYQDWEAKLMLEELKGIVPNPSVTEGLIEKWHAWTHVGKNHERAGRPLDQFLTDEMEMLKKRATSWAKSHKEETAGARDVVEVYLAENPGYEYEWMYRVISDAESNAKWETLKSDFNEEAKVEDYLASPSTSWSKEKMEEFNHELSGHIFIPQPFATLRNGSEVQSGLGISRYMIIEVLVAIIVFFVFKWLAGRVSTGDAPKGKAWNLLESMVSFVKEGIVVPAMGAKDAGKYMPLFWTLFFFILGMNLMGMIPGMGAPTSVLGTTGALALVVLGVGMVEGIKKFGVLGYLKNLSPSLGLPLWIAIPVVPLVWIIEAASLFIKHAVLAARLLFNMVAGHLVLLGIMGIGFGVHAMDMSSSTWTLVGGISIVGATLLSFLELFVAFLQAYIFTFLAAMFIGNAIHHH